VVHRRTPSYLCTGFFNASQCILRADSQMAECGHVFLESAFVLKLRQASDAGGCSKMEWFPILK
jgi:hypothetical protein